MPWSAALSASSHRRRAIRPRSSDRAQARRRARRACSPFRRRPAWSAKFAAPSACRRRSPLDRIPREHVARTIERRERGGKGAFELRVELFRGPAVGAMQRADRTGLIEQIDLVVAHRKYLAADAFRAIRRKINDERRDFLRRHFAEP